MRNISLAKNLAKDLRDNLEPLQRVSGQLHDYEDDAPYYLHDVGIHMDVLDDTIDRLERQINVLDALISIEESGS